MSSRFLKTAVVSFVLVVALGIYMGATQDLTQRPVHAFVLFAINVWRTIPAAA